MSDIKAALIAALHVAFTGRWGQCTHLGPEGEWTCNDIAASPSMQAWADALTAAEADADALRLRLNEIATVWCSSGARRP